MKIVFKKLEAQDIREDFLHTFNRYQDVKKCWRKEKGEWVLKDIAFIEQWNAQDKAEVISSLIETIVEKGSVFGAFINEDLVGFSSVEGKLIGSRKQYGVLHHIHTGYEYRGKGIGKELFVKSCEYARSIGARKLYISGHSSEESQAFYRAMGCNETEEIDARLYELEPCDCHLEFDLY